MMRYGFEGKVTKIIHCFYIINFELTHFNTLAHHSGDANGACRSKDLTRPALLLTYDLLPDCPYYLLLLTYLVYISVSP